MSEMVHINTMRTMLRSGCICSLKWWKEDGSIATADQVICTSSFFAGNSFNIKFLNSGEFRKILAITIFEINDMEVFI